MLIERVNSARQKACEIPLISQTDCYLLIRVFCVVSVIFMSIRLTSVLLSNISAEANLAAVTVAAVLASLTT